MAVSAVATPKHQRNPHKVANLGRQTDGGRLLRDRRRVEHRATAAHQQASREPAARGDLGFRFLSPFTASRDR